MDNNLDDDVKDILAILQQGSVSEAPQTEEKKNTPTNKIKKTKIGEKPNSVENKEKKTLLVDRPKSAFLADLNEPGDKSIYNSKVLIREEIYEIFMSLKRIKKFKSVSTLVDFALEEYIKNNRENIRNTLYDSKKHEIL